MSFLVLTWVDANSRRKASPVRRFPGSGDLALASILTCRVQIGFLLLIASLWLAGCGSGGAAPPPGGGGQQTSVTLTASATTITAGALSTLTWTSTHATSITITPAPVTDDDTPLSLSGSLPVAPTQTTTYTVTATGPNGTASRSVTITVNQPPPEITSLVAAPALIIAGQSSTLSWGTEHATSLTINQGVGPQPVPSGSVTVTPAATTTYTATASGPGGSTTATVTVTIAAPGQLAITVAASPQTIAPGGSATLSWQSQSATSVSFDQGIGAVALNGSLSVSPAQTTTYTATATNGGGNSQTASATVTVVAGSGVSKLQHIIFLMQENRSLDHYFGGLGRYRQSQSLPANFDGLDLATTLTDFHGHQVQSFHFQTTCHDNTSPGWNESHFFANRDPSTGLFGMDFWMEQVEDSQHSTIDPHYTRTMGYYDQRDIPYYYELATQFATSDRWFSALMGPTIPNRLYLFTATSFGNIFPINAPPGGFTQKTIFELLNQHGISWKYYYRDSSVFLAQFDLWSDPVSQGLVRNISEYYSILADPNADTLLPQVVFLEQAAQTQLNEHPTNTDGIQSGAADTKKLIDALMASKAWPTSAFILTYDEAGGLYDHVPPISVPPPDNIAPIFQPGDIGQWDSFNYSGFRVPVVIVSPWVKKQHVSHDPMDFTAILWLIENRFGLPPLTQRDANPANAKILDFFDFSAPAWLTPPPLPNQPTNGVCDRNLGKDPNH